VKKINVILLGVLMTFGLSLSAQATTWNLASDFSTASNPNGAWTYGYEQTYNGALTLYPNSNAVAWYDPSNNDYGTPSVWKNTSPVTSYGVLSGEVSLHSGSHNEFSVARWTSSVAGLINVNGYFGAGDIYPMSYYISENRTSTLLSDWSDSYTKSFSLSTTVAVGDTIDFLVGVGAQSFWYGNTPVGATISFDQNTPVPEPSTMALLGLGMVGLAVCGKRRQNNKA
jgi:hypothetical protein